MNAQGAQIMYRCVCRCGHAELYPSIGDRLLYARAVVGISAPTVRAAAARHSNVTQLNLRKAPGHFSRDRKSTRLNSSHLVISYAVFCLKKKKKNNTTYFV